MIRRTLALLAMAAACAVLPSTARAQTPVKPAAHAATPMAATAKFPKLPERSIRGDIPMTNTIQRAFAAGTRDSTGRPGKNYWQLWMEYTINAKLEPATSTLTGHETIVLHNNSPDAMTQIRMRLDQNIFRPNVPRGASTPSEITDGFTITKLSVNGLAADMNAGGGRGGRGGGGGGRGRGAAADPNAAAPAGPTVPTLQGFNTTSGVVMLPTPIASHTSATLEIDYSFHVPGGPGGSGHRMTMRWGDSLYQITQWYPRVAVYDDLRGWDTDPYLGPSEFYNNFGHFDVSLDVPAGWIVGATGVLQNPQQVLTPTARERLSHVLESDSTRTIVGADENGPGKSTAAGDRLVWHFVADTANDFAWGTAKNFVWQATRATIPGAHAIPVNILFNRGRDGMVANAGPILRHALEFYSKLWGPEPFPVHTMLEGPDNGMEYPMIVMAASNAADHETGHEWWPMMDSGNETWYGFMDEGYNQYMNILSNADPYPGGRAGGGGGGRGGGCAVRDLVPAGGSGLLNCTGQSYGPHSGQETEGPLMWDANYGGPGYSYQAYSKTPLMLSMLGGVVGDSAVWHAQNVYSKAWRFKHPSPWDYMFIMDNTLHQDLGWFWYYWLFTTESVDGSIAKVTTVGPVTTVAVHQAGQMPSPVVLKVQFDPKGPPIKQMPNSRKVDSLTSVVTWPVDVWFNGSRTYSAKLSFGGRKIDRIVLDPYCRFPDKAPGDNVWPKVEAPDAAPAAGAAAPAAGRGGRGGRGGGGGGRGGRGAADAGVCSM